MEISGKRQPTEQSLLQSRQHPLQQQPRHKESEGKPRHRGSLAAGEACLLVSASWRWVFLPCCCLPCLLTAELSSSGSNMDRGPFQDSSRPLAPDRESRASRWVLSLSGMLVNTADWSILHSRSQSNTRPLFILCLHPIVSVPLEKPTKTQQRVGSP